MVDLKKLQEDIYQNKVNKWFNVTDVCMEFNLLNCELAEAFESYLKEKWNVWEELADVAIFTLWLAEILWVNLEEEILRKIEINKNRKYKKCWNWHVKVL